MKQQIFVERLQQTKPDVWEWAPELEEFNLEEDFGINENELTAEICKIGMLLVRYGSIAGEVQANKERKEESLKLVKAQLDAAIRSQAETTGTKLTVNQIDAQIIASQAYQDALAPLHTLRADAIKTDHWWRSVVKKADLLNALAFRQSAEIRKGGY